jgi:hypothetical protein
VGKKRLQAEREGGYCQADIKRDIFETAKADGKEIQQRRGRRMPTQRLREGTWHPV